ncbi:MAG: TonB-dependent receptor [Bryobacterales bacterium]|nr:TonB-dependent receptor [Bryobacterales bacterium]
MASIMGRLAFATLAITLGAQAATVIRGTVQDTQGLPISGANIVLRHVLTGATATETTAQDGRFEFSATVRGAYRISATADNLRETSVTRTVSATEGEAEDITLILAPSGEHTRVTVYSGSRVEELIEESPVKVDVVTRQDMVSTGYERVSDILAEVPGVITRSGSTATVAAEQIQGIDSRQVLVLQDGLPIVGARGIKRGALNLNRQSAAPLERIEVVKGAASPLFGSDAIGGVINMITREPTRPFEGNATVSGGSLGMFDARMDVGTRWKKLSVFLDLEQHRMNSYTLFPNSPTTVGPDWRRNDVVLRSRYQLSERAAFTVLANGYHNREEGRNRGETGFTQGLSNDSTQNYAVIADLLPTNTTTLQLRAYSARYDENSTQTVIGRPDPPALANLNQRYKRLDGTISQQLGLRQFLQGGYEWTQDHYRGVNRLVGDNAGQQITANDVWLQDKIDVTRRIKLNIGGRVTSHSLFGTWAVPKAGLVVKLNDQWVVRASFGRGFRAPDLGQLYFRFANPATFYQVIGNPNLRPETSRSFSAGINYQSRRLRAGLNLYRNDVGSLIEAINVGRPNTPPQLRGILDTYGIPSSFDPLLNRLTFVYLNFNRIYTQGFELNGDVTLTRTLRLGGAYTYLNPVDAVTRLHLPQRHRHQGFVRTEYNNPRWGLLANLRGTFFSNFLLNPAQGTRAFGYAIWDAYASKRLTRNVEFYGSVDNLANSRDRKLNLPTPTFDRPDYGRMYRAGLRFRLTRDE